MPFVKKSLAWLFILVSNPTWVYKKRERGTETKSALYIWMYVGNSKYIFSFYYTKKRMALTNIRNKE